MESLTTDIFKKSPRIFEASIRQVKSVKGLESVYCRYASSAHYSCMEEYQICFDRQAALRYTVIYGRYACFQYLLKGVRYLEQLNYKYVYPDKSSHTLLSLCGVHGYLKGMQHLIKDKADINSLTVNSKGETLNVLMAICDNPYGHEERLLKCVKYLLDMKLIKVNETNTQGQTALMFATRAKARNIVSLLLSYGADASMSDMRGLRAEDF